MNGKVDFLSRIWGSGKSKVSSPTKIGVLDRMIGLVKLQSSPPPSSVSAAPKSSRLAADLLHLLGVSCSALSIFLQFHEYHVDLTLSVLNLFLLQETVIELFVVRLRTRHQRSREGASAQSAPVLQPRRGYTK